MLVNGNNNTEPREIFLDSFSKRFNASIVTSQSGERQQKIIGLGGSKRNNRHVQPMQPHQMPIPLQPEVPTQSYHQPYVPPRRV